MGKPVDLTGQRIGKWSVVREGTKSNWDRRRWVCRCECGREQLVNAGDLQKGESLGCKYCANREKKVTHGMTKTPTFVSWTRMLQRCYNSKYNRFNDYGGRGITVCDRWRDSFETFFKDMGERPRGLTLERIDNNGNYDPDNCRWATPKEQAENRRNNVWIEWQGETKTQADWARQLGVSNGFINYYLKRGIPFSDIVSISQTRCSSKPMV